MGVDKCKGSWRWLDGELHIHAINTRMHGAEMLAAHTFLVPRGLGACATWANKGPHTHAHTNVPPCAHVRACLLVLIVCLHAYSYMHTKEAQGTRPQPR